METLRNLLSQEIIQRLGWTLVHFVWQGMTIGLALAVVLKLLNKSSANLRYMLACAALVLIVVMPAVTIRMVDVSILGINQAGIDLLNASSNVQVAVEMPQIEMPQVGSLSAPVIVVPEVTLQDRFVRAVESALPYVVVGWFIGVFGLSLWHLGGWTQLQRLRRQMVNPVSERVHLRLRRLSEQMGLKRAVAIMESALVAVPTVVGHLKPVILLPASALTGLSAEQIEAILAHELAHIKRCDYLINMLQTVVEILGFYHPAVWWVSQKIRIERENCCDDMAVGVSGDRISYAKALASMEEIRAGQLPLAVAASGGSLFDRIGRLLGKDSTNEGKLSWLPSVMAMLLIVALLIPTALALSSKAKSNLGSMQINEVPDNLINLTSVKPKDITVAQLADICEAQESSIGSINISYEWYNEPPMTIEDIAGSGILINKGRPRYELLTSRPFSERIRLIQWATFMNSKGDSWDSIDRSSYDGNISKHLTIGNSLRESDKDATVVRGRRFVSESMNLTPLGFSILRPSFDVVVGQKLSTMLRDYKDLVVLDNTVSEINRLGCIRIDLLQQQTKRPVMSIYFSPEYGYAPVRYEYLNGPKVSISVDVTSFQQVAKGLWFPSDGIIKAAGAKRANVYKAIGSISINEGISDADFDIVFPVGTKVDDQIHGRSYIVEPTREQKEEFDKEQEYIKEHADEIKAEQEQGGRIFSASMLRRLGTARDLYFSDNDKELPKKLSDLKSYLDDETFSWLSKNIIYLGVVEKLGEIDPIKTPLAYDRTILEKSGDTNVLFLDGSARFVRHDQLEKLGITTEKRPARQILTSGYILSVPADWARLKEIISEDKSKPLIITSEKLEELLTAAGNTPGARMLVTPQILTNDGEVGEIRMENAQDLKSLNIKNTVGADGKTVTLEFDFRYSTGQDMVASVSNKATLLSGQAMAVSGGVSENKAIVLIVKPEVQEKQFSKTGVVQTESSTGQVEAEQGNMIHGIVRDQSGNPVSGALVLPMPHGGRPVKTGANGRFELAGPDAEAERVIVRDIENNRAVAVDMEDSKGPFDITLTAGISLKGRVVDSDGNPIAGAMVFPSVTSERWSATFGFTVFKPTDSDGYFEIKALPMGQDYTIEASAHDYSSSSVRLGIWDKPGQKELDDIVLEDHVRWREAFDRVYRLDDGQVLKRVAPPYIQERTDYYRNETASQSSSISEPPYCITFHWDGKLKTWGLSFGGKGNNSKSLANVLAHSLQVGVDEFEGPAELLELKVPGDWIVRSKVSKEEKLRALEEILKDEIGREIHFVKRKVNREAIIATGKYEFHRPLGTYNDSEIHFYSDVLDANEGHGGGTAESVSDILDVLGQLTGMQVIDNTQAGAFSRIGYGHHSSSRTREIKDLGEKTTKLRLMLNNLEKQTNLKFKTEMRIVEKWFVVEGNAKPDSAGSGN